MEEADVRISETKKEHYEFERDIIKGSINKRTHKVISEKVIRFFEEKLKARVSLIFLILIFVTLESQNSSPLSYIINETLQQRKWCNSFFLAVVFIQIHLNKFVLMNMLVCSK